MFTFPMCHYGLWLPRVTGLYTDVVSIHGLPNLTVAGTSNPATCVELSPNKYNLVNITGTFETSASQPAIFLWLHDFKLSGTIQANGAPGQAGAGDGSVGGQGGAGPCSGGGGAQLQLAGFATGGTGGYNADPQGYAGNGDYPGAGGTKTYPVGGYTYASWGSGQDTVAGTAPVFAGAAWPGADVTNEGGGTIIYEGEGEGETAPTPIAGDGGAGGGGGIAVICNIWSVSTGNINALDGDGNPSGVAFIAAMHKTDSNSPTSGAANLQIYQINPDGSLTSKNGTDTW